MRQQWNVLKGCDTRASHHLLIGTPSQNDTILLFHHVNKLSKWLRFRSETIKYPSDNAESREKPAIISAIAIIDGRKDGTGGEAKILDGGVGSRNVTINLASQWFKGFAFIVIIIGRYENSWTKELFVLMKETIQIALINFFKSFVSN